LECFSVGFYLYKSIYCLAVVICFNPMQGLYFASALNERSEFSTATQNTERERAQMDYKHITTVSNNISKITLAL
nr:hypothetical protein [Lachnospiraceae bacterium]